MNEIRLNKRLVYNPICFTKSISVCPLKFYKKMFPLK